MIIKTGDGKILDIVKENVPEDEKIRESLNVALVEAAKKELEKKEIENNNN